MTLALRFALSVAAAALLPAAALAADYDPPLLIEDAPEYVPVEVGSGWYIRGDVGYNVNSTPYDFTYAGVGTDNSHIFGGLGMGYHFTDYLRGELNLAFLSRDTWDATLGLVDISLKNSVWSGMANVYADLGTFAGFTPYVGAGAGMVYSRSKARFESPTVSVSWRDDQYKFAYSLNAGVAYQVSQNLQVDLGYQYLSAPGLDYIDSDTHETRSGVDYHQIKLGLRYDLW